MRTNLAIVVLLLCLLAIASTQTALAQTATVGVNAGNTFKYSYTLTWESTDHAATMPSEYAKLRDTEFVQLSIVSVEGTLVNVDFTRHFKDGTESKENGNIDVNTQILGIPYSVIIIRAGANPGEKIYPLGGHATLNDTSTKTYPVGQIETIRYISPATTGSSIEKTEIFYDRANGVGVEYNLETQETSGSYVTTTKETLMITSWEITATTPEFPLTAVLLILLIAIPIVLLVVYKKKRSISRKPLEQ
jgi:hypothetical protein